jgi:hypothetical protein
MASGFRGTTTIDGTLLADGECFAQLAIVQVEVEDPPRGAGHEAL